MKDKLTRKAKKEGYKARSAYKLLALQKKYHLMKKNDRVLDLGCWPGSWLQVASQFAKEVIGVDKRETTISGIETHIIDIFDERIFELGKFNVVLSDAAPTTTGNKLLDQQKSYDLSMRSFNIACKLLNKKGNFLVKVFQSGESDKLIKPMREKFHFVKTVKPFGSKKRSKEVYLLGLEFK